MKNKEKYYEEIMETFCNRRCTCEFKSKHVFKSDGCENIRCLDCGELTKQWLEAEYVEPIRLTKNEKAILESIDKDYTYIARNKEGELHVYMSRPYKDGRYWQVYHAGVREFVFHHLFQFITFDDAEPYSIEELLKCEVVENVD